MSNKFLALFLFMSTALIGIGQTVKSNPFGLVLKSLLSDDIPSKDVYEIEDLSKFQLLDARAKEEFEVSHLQKAYWVGYEDFNLERIKNLDPQKPTLVYCSVGYRSEKITEKLIEAGFTQVFNLYGGIFEWANAGKPVYKENTTVNQVHGYDKVWGVWLNIDEKVY